MRVRLMSYKFLTWLGNIETDNYWIIGIIKIGGEFFTTSVPKVDESGEVKLKMEGDKGKRKVFKNLPPSFELSISIYW